MKGLKEIGTIFLLKYFFLLLYFCQQRCSYKASLPEYRQLPSCMGRRQKSLLCKNAHPPLSSVNPLCNSLAPLPSTVIIFSLTLPLSNFDHKRMSAMLTLSPLCKSLSLFFVNAMLMEPNSSAK